MTSVAETVLALVHMETIGYADDVLSILRA